MSPDSVTETAMAYRPNEVARLLGIAPVTLRGWSNEFAALLSDSARRTVTADGKAAQRRYSDVDIEIFKRAKGLLAGGLTFDEARRQLLSDTAPSSSTDLTQIADTARYLAELKSLYDEGLAARDEALSAKDETIREQRSHIETLQQQLQRLEQRIGELETDIDHQRNRQPSWWRRLFGGE